MCQFSELGGGRLLERLVNRDGVAVVTALVLLRQPLSVLLCEFTAQSKVNEMI